jgi:uncharacterized protein (TIGR02118 family)
MIVRSAYLEGTVEAGDRAGFDRHMAEAVLPALAKYPGVRQVRLRRPVAADAGAPQVYLVFDLYFDSLEAMRAALASEVRQEVVASFGSAMPKFKGRAYHVMFEES